MKNKGSCNDPSSAFKISAVILISLLVFGADISGEKTALNVGVPMFTSEKEENLFLKSDFSVINISEMIVSQENTLYASSPLHIPGSIQVLGVKIEEPACRGDIISYKVEEGETINSIALKFGISSETVISANNIKGNSVKKGQDLVILPVSGVFHIAKSGDSVSGIAKTYQAEKKEILSCNEMEDEKIFAGDILIVPGGKMPKPVASSSVQSLPSSSPTGVSWIIPPASGVVSQGLHWHNAVDIANVCGAYVYAAAAGTVQQTGYHNIAGNYVRILHSNGVVTFYGHLSRIRVSPGQRVSQGSLIGNIGNTGYTIGATGCHLHFEVRGAANPLASYRVGHRF